MQLWKQIMLDGYVHATRAARTQRRNALARAGRSPVCILFYHRVADHTPNDWTISNSQFERQMRWLAGRADFVSLEEAQHRLKHGNDRMAVSVTFDDGYADNCDRAIPYLTANNIPCTYFVSLDFVQTGRPFPHDKSADQPLTPNSMEQLKQMAEAGVEIGGHTRNHPDLGQVHDETTLIDEVVTSSAELATEVGCDVRYFAFPFGKPENLNRRAAQLAMQAGFQGIVSAFGAYNLPGSNTSTFHMRRIHGDPEMARLRNWITFDGRKCAASNQGQLIDVDATCDNKLAQETS